METCCVFHECYIKDGSCKSHGKLLGLSRAKLRALGSKPTITSPNFEVKIQCNILYSMELSTKTLALSFKLSHEILMKISEDKKRNLHVLLALLLHNTVQVESVDMMSILLQLQL